VEHNDRCLANLVKISLHQVGKKKTFPHPPIAFMPVAVDTSVRIYDDFLRVLFCHSYREASALSNDIPNPVTFVFFALLV
jgi:hypothetical protein